MLFNSHIFIFVFLPVALAGFALLSRLGPRTACAWLAVCSIAFYGYWNPAYLGVLVGSIALNFTIGHMIGRRSDAAARNRLLTVGVILNLLVLVVFKYLEPTLRALHRHELISVDVDLSIILPLGLSFFTFTQIGYLVDRRDGLGEDLDLVRYVTFVTFFPHLIAGPILHVRDIGPQLADPDRLRIEPSNLAVGTTIFVLGLSKKVLLADPLAMVVERGFGDPAALGLVFSWVAALAYSVQLYFDFSGYSDMAIGLAILFGLRFPLNFNSPYKARSIIEFWQRWHITLSRYLNLLLYNPVALNMTRRRAARGKGVGAKDRRTPSAFVSLVVFPTLWTMALAGIWHGAGLQFLIFGLLHAAYLVINHAWRIWGPKSKTDARPWSHRIAVAAAQAGLTYLAVLAAQVFFRAKSAADAVEMLAAMVGLRGLGLPVAVVERLPTLGDFGARLVGQPGIQGPTDVADHWTLLRLTVSFLVIWLAPNVQQIMAGASPHLEGPSKPAAPSWMQWRPNAVWAGGIGLLFLFNILSLRETTVFLYFQF